MSDNFTNTDDLNVGDTVYVSMGRYGRIDVRKGTVLSKSATGVIKVDCGTNAPSSFMRYGVERNGDKYHPYRLISFVSYQRLIERQNADGHAQAANATIKAVNDIQVIAHNKQKLIDALNAALEK